MPEPWEDFHWHQWKEAWGEIILRVCEIVFSKQGSKLYDVRRDSELRADLEDWLIVEAMEMANEFLPDPWLHSPHLQFAKYLHVGLNMRARYHFSDIVGRSEHPSGAAARQAYSRGIMSTDALDASVADGYRPVTRHPLHGTDLMAENPPEILIRLEEIQTAARQIERDDRREGIYTTSGSACLTNLCSGPVVAWGLCDSHYRKQKTLMGGDAGLGCNVPGCLDGHSRRGLCSKHVQAYTTGQNPEWLEPYVETERLKPGPKPGVRKTNPDTCTEEGCTKPTYTMRRCRPHYRKHKKATAAPCTVDGCDSPQFGRKMCTIHYRLWLEARDEGRGDE
ncbi:hypothetical protein H5392_01350 [Tessaracoccus sp. MC1865]|uniref:hypothetical protein n=1 Tax=Tessaracoccus sp. MC1865 TaxID=2760310 RepID=UPI0016027A9A|nr:hypothetical protein [Tessaracoccus sp. MC1865]MBB1482503.1 hypothetical protein [Tessaracoccus sp. MC1865]QTO38042.1 hypothetical protein J7D54_02740 [Tessaracoccus sp. MC1865]